MSQLRHQLRQIVGDFVTAVLGAVSAGSLEEFVEGTSRRSTRCCSRWSTYAAPRSWYGCFRVSII